MAGVSYRAKFDERPNGHAENAAKIIAQWIF
jgi:hypothetical protein